MKTREQVVAGYESKTIDGRDRARLLDFWPEEEFHQLGFEVIEGKEGVHEYKEWTRENILEQLKHDVAFGFEKALNQRGISSYLMFEVVGMWNWILEEGLEDFSSEDNYAQYGLPLFKATAVKYGFNNPIGEDSGSESKYSSDWQH
jgi:hypothetical protein